MILKFFEMFEIFRTQPAPSSRVASQQGKTLLLLQLLLFFCWLAALGWLFRETPWRLNHFVVKTLMPATASS